MALSPQTYQYISQLGVQRVVDASTGPAGPSGVSASLLVPTGGWHNGQRFPHAVEEDLKAAKLSKTTVEGVEYFLVPEVSSNLPGRLSHYAQTTGVADLANPPGGGVNRVRETLEQTADTTTSPDDVADFVKENDSFEEARQKVSDEDARVARQVGAGTGSPASASAPSKKVEKKAV